MRNKILYFFILFFVLQCKAHHSIEEHNNDLRCTLFGNNKISQKGELNFRLIYEAVNIVTDFTSDNEYKDSGRRYLADLKANGVKNVPNIFEISFSGNQYHQIYTHYGWDKGYRTIDKGNWQKRKLLLLSTVEHVGQNTLKEKIKIDAFAGLIYDIHILGDHIGDGEKTRHTRIRLVSEPGYKGQWVSATSDGPFNNPTLFTYLRYHIERLFREQKNTSAYQTLIAFLTHNNNRVYNYSAKEVPYEEIKKIAKETRDKLHCYLPELLKNERFFKNAFYN